MHLNTEGSVPKPVPFTTTCDFIIGLAVDFDKEVMVGNPVVVKV